MKNKKFPIVCIKALNYDIFDRTLKSTWRFHLYYFDFIAFDKFYIKKKIKNRKAIYL